ncbi:hypothetical protein [Nostoc sp. DSM 114159]|jgi:hypothetical protein
MCTSFTSKVLYIPPTCTVAKAQEQGTALGLNASYLSISNGIEPIIAGTLIHSSIASHNL